jgi:hypothetical protein
MRLRARATAATGMPCACSALTASQAATPWGMTLLPRGLEALAPSTTYRCDGQGATARHECLRRAGRCLTRNASC